MPHEPTHNTCPSNHPSKPDRHKICLAPGGGKSNTLSRLIELYASTTLGKPES